MDTHRESNFYNDKLQMSNIKSSFNHKLQNRFMIEIL